MLNIPEVKLTYKIEFAKDFLDKKQVDKTKEPDILKVSIRGLEAYATCVETNMMLKVIAVGMSDGKIKAFFFYEETVKDVEGDKLAPPVKSNLQTILDTDISEIVDGIKECTLLGHFGSVTSLSMSYDSYYMVSGSTDCSVRLWSLKTG